MTDTDQLDFMKKQLDFYNESGNKTKAFTPYTYKYSDFERLRIMFDYGIDLDASICYLDFEKPFNYLMYQLRTLINYGVDTKLTIIVNTNIQSESQRVTYIEYINSIVEANKINIQLFCRSYSITNPTLKFLKAYKGEVIILKNILSTNQIATNALAEIHSNFKNIKLI